MSGDAPNPFEEIVAGWRDELEAHYERKRSVGRIVMGVGCVVGGALAVVGTVAIGLTLSATEPTRDVITQRSGGAVACIAACFALGAALVALIRRVSGPERWIEPESLVWVGGVRGTIGTMGDDGFAFEAIDSAARMGPDGRSVNVRFESQVLVGGELVGGDGLLLRVAEQVPIKVPRHGRGDPRSDHDRHADAMAGRCHLLIAGQLEGVTIGCDVLAEGAALANVRALREGTRAELLLAASPIHPLRLVRVLRRAHE